MNEEVIPVMNASRVNSLWTSWADTARQAQSFASDLVRENTRQLTLQVSVLS